VIVFFGIGRAYRHKHFETVNTFVGKGTGKPCGKWLANRCLVYVQSVFLAMFYLLYSVLFVANFVSDVAVFVLKRDVKLQPTNFVAN